MEHFVNSPQFKEVQQYIESTLDMYSVAIIKNHNNVDELKGLNHAYKVLSKAFTQMEKDYKIKKDKVLVDHTR